MAFESCAVLPTASDVHSLTAAVAALHGATSPLGATGAQRDHSGRRSRAVGPGQQDRT
jgi:hypothetical protein